MEHAQKYHGKWQIEMIVTPKTTELIPFFSWLYFYVSVRIQDKWKTKPEVDISVTFN